ncbi:hypothetical protein Tco_0328000 [Tanacetum coccineum]
MENANPSSSTLNSEFLDPKKKLEIESWLEDSKIVYPLVSSNNIEYFNTFPTLEELGYHEWLLKYPKPYWVKENIRTRNLNNIKIYCMIGHFLKRQAYLDLESPINIMSRLHYNWIMSNRKRERLFLKKDNDKITFKMPHKMETFNHIDFKDVNTDSIPPFILEDNNNRGKTYYSDNLTLGPEYREDESISKEIRHLMKLERKAIRNKGEVTLYLMRRSLEVLRKFPLDDSLRTI